MPLGVYGASSHIFIDHSVGDVNIMQTAFTPQDLFLVPYFGWVNLGAQVIFFL